MHDGARIMRTHFFALLVAVTACGTTSIDSNDQLDAPTGKADAASKPSGSYTNPHPLVGQFSVLTLNDDHTFTRDQVGLCPGGGTCEPTHQTGTYLFTHSTTNRYIRFYADDGSDLDRYKWKLTTGSLELTVDSQTSWFTMNQGSTCQAAGGTCVPLVPDACAIGTIGDATQYSCGGGLGVMCCLPPAAPACQDASDCSGLLPQFCQTCADGTVACAHWSCVDNTCAIESCAN